MWAVVHDSVVYLIGNQPQIMPHCEPDEFVSLSLSDIASSGVARKVVQYSHSVLIDSRFQILNGRDEAIVECARIKIRLTSADNHIWRIEREVRLGQHYIVSGLDQCEEDVEQPVGTTHRDADVAIIQV